MMVYPRSSRMEEATPKQAWRSDLESRNTYCVNVVSGLPKAIDTADALDHLSCHLVHLVHLGQHDDPAISRYFSPILEARWQAFPTTTGLKTFLDICKALTKINSNKSLGILNSSAVADEQKCKATVWVTLTVSNLPATDHLSVCQETVCKMDWRLGKNGWVCVRHTSMRAPAFVGTF